MSLIIVISGIVILSPAISEIYAPSNGLVYLKQGDDCFPMEFG